MPGSWKECLPPCGQKERCWAKFGLAELLESGWGPAGKDRLAAEEAEERSKKSRGSTGIRTRDLAQIKFTTRSANHKSTRLSTRDDLIFRICATGLHSKKAHDASHANLETGVVEQGEGGPWRERWRSWGARACCS